VLTNEPNGEEGGVARLVLVGGLGEGEETLEAFEDGGHWVSA
jgi:hypothetical protein